MAGKILTPTNMMKELLTDMFGGKNSEEYNALMSALTRSAEKNGKEIYEYLEETPKTTFIVNMVDELRDMGYKITK